MDGGDLSLVWHATYSGVHVQRKFQYGDHQDIKVKVNAELNSDSNGSLSDVSRPYLCTGYDIYLVWEPCASIEYTYKVELVPEQFCQIARRCATGLKHVPSVCTKVVRVNRRSFSKKSRVPIGAKLYIVAELELATNNFGRSNFVGFMHIPKIKLFASTAVRFPSLCLLYTGGTLAGSELMLTEHNLQLPIAEDMRERWETSDHLVVHKIQDINESVFKETDAAMSLKEVRRRDPYFSLPDFVYDVQEIVKPVLKAYNQGETEELEKYCSP
ncbi:mitochondrial import inner membrane translocase subunit TIM44-2 [Tanacetum coccineum]